MNSLNKDKVNICDMTLEFENCILKSAKLNREIPLSLSECFILKYLLESSPQTLKREYLLEHCWPGKVVTGSSLNVAIKNIRTALKELDADFKVVTVQKEGYCIPNLNSRSQQQGLELAGDAEKAQLETLSLPEANVETQSIESTPQPVVAEEKAVDIRQTSWLPKSISVASLAGWAASALIVVGFYNVTFFIEKDKYQGIEVYHDGTLSNLEQLPDLLSHAGVQSDVVVLHRNSIRCKSTQIMVTKGSDAGEDLVWQDMSELNETLCTPKEPSYA